MYSTTLRIQAHYNILVLLPYGDLPIGAQSISDKKNVAAWQPAYSKYVAVECEVTGPIV